MKIAKWKVFYWANNEVGSLIFHNFEGASNWISETIDRVYGANLTDDEHGQQRDEYSIIEVTSKGYIL